MGPDGLAAHLARRLPSLGPAGTPEALSGGLMNHVWRVPVGATTVVVKYAPPYVAAAPDIPVDASRLGFEYAALVVVGEAMAHLLGDAVRPPQALDYDAAAGVLVMEDLGPGLPLDALLRDGAVDHGGGVALGAFVARLHRLSRDEKALAVRFDNAPVQATRARVQYQAVRGWLDALGLPGDALGPDAEALGRRLQGRGRCLVMGDLWPPSVLKTDAGWRLLDWEFSHYGLPAQDVGHLLAHLWMARDRAAGPAVRAAVAAYEAGFLAAYRDGVRGLDLWDDAGQAALRVHRECEVLARTCGPFRGGSWYQDASDDEAHGALTRCRAEDAPRV